MFIEADINPTNTEMTDDESERHLILQTYRHLLHSFKTPPDEKDLKMLRAAFDLAVEAHREQRRKSGEP